MYKDDMKDPAVGLYHFKMILQAFCSFIKDLSWTDQCSNTGQIGYSAETRIWEHIPPPPQHKALACLQ